MIKQELAWCKIHVWKALFVPFCHNSIGENKLSVSAIYRLTGNGQSLATGRIIWLPFPKDDTIDIYVVNTRVLHHIYELQSKSPLLHVHDIQDIPHRIQGRRHITLDALCGQSSSVNLTGVKQITVKKIHNGADDRAPIVLQHHCELHSIIAPCSKESSGNVHFIILMVDLLWSIVSGFLVDTNHEFSTYKVPHIFSSYIGYKLAVEFPDVGCQYIRVYHNYTEEVFRCPFEARRYASYLQLHLIQIILFGPNLGITIEVSSVGDIALNDHYMAMQEQYAKKVVLDIDPGTRVIEMFNREWVNIQPFRGRPITESILYGISRNGIIYEIMGLTSNSTPASQDLIHTIR